MRQFRTIILLLVTLAFCMPVKAEEYPLGWIPEKQNRLVNDLYGLFTPDQVNELEHRLVAFDDSTSNQIMVLITPSLGGDAIESFSHKVAQGWGVGTKEYKNGVVIVLKPKNDEGDGQVRIEVGYGLEGALPDIFCSSIIEEDMIPHFREGDYYAGVVAAIDVIEAVCVGEYSYERRKEEQKGDMIAALVVLGIVVLMLVMLTRYAKKHPEQFQSSAPGGPFFGSSMGGSTGSWGSFSGGSSGFGGGFGGFGGFGGGSFGGGGASGRW